MSTRFDPGGLGRSVGSHDAHAAAAVGLGEGEVAEIARPVVLVVEPAAGEFDPFDGGAPAGERDEHLRWGVGIE
jgi:hypothetical protein